jgi:hypothetical protein
MIPDAVRKLAMPAVFHRPLVTILRRVARLAVVVAGLLLADGAAASGDTLAGRWKLLAAEDLRADGSVARLPWGARPIGSIVVEDGSCYLQIMSSDVPVFAAGDAAILDRMKAALLSTYIAYAGPCVVDEGEGKVTLTVEAAWRPDYVGTEQVRYFRFENGRLLFGPAPNSIRFGDERLTRRLTLERAGAEPARRR